MHGEKYNYDNVEYKSNKKKVKIICNIHGEFEQRPVDHLRGSGCIECGKNAMKTKNTGIEIEQNKILNTNDFIDQAEEIHDCYYDYTKTKFVNNSSKVTIICPKHGEFEQKARRHLEGAGCIGCAKDRSAANQKSSKENFIKRVKEFHEDKYDYSKVDYINSKIEVTIICPKHGEFKQVPFNHYKAGCLQCSIEERGLKSRLNTEEFIKKAKEIHGDKYDYSKSVYDKAIKPIIIICRTHGEFKQTPTAHYRGIDCSKCTLSGYSRDSINWLNSVAQNENIEIQHAENGGEKRISKSRYRADGYCEETNTIFEYHGCLFHGCPLCFNGEDNNPVIGDKNKNLYKKTIEKENFIKSQGYNLVVMWEHDWKK